MKSYLFLLAVCVPLFLTLGQECKSLGEHYYKLIYDEGTKDDGTKQLKSALTDLSSPKKFKIDQTVLDGALGLAPIPEDKAGDRSGLELVLSDNFSPIAKTEQAVKNFVAAYQTTRTLPAVELASLPNANDLRTILTDRSKMKDEDKKVENSFTDPEKTPESYGRDFREYATRPYGDTLKAERLLGLSGRDPFTDPDRVKKGTVLVVVIKTSELVEESESTAKALDLILKDIRSDEKLRSALVAGSFCLMKDTEAPEDKTLKDQRYSAWPGSEYLKPTELFGREKGKEALIKAIEVAEKIKSTRAGKKFSAVQIIYRSEAPPTGAPNASGPASRLNDGTSVSVIWIANNQNARSDSLERWFPGQFNVYARADSGTLTNDLSPEIRAPLNEAPRE